MFSIRFCDLMMLENRLANYGLGWLAGPACWARPVWSAGAGRLGRAVRAGWLAGGAVGRWCGWPLVRLAVGAAGLLVRLAAAAAVRWCAWPLLRLAVAAAGRCCGWPLLRLAVGTAGRGCGGWGATLQKCETVAKNRPWRGAQRNATRNPSKIKSCINFLFIKLKGCALRCALALSKACFW